MDHLTRWQLAEIKAKLCAIICRLDDPLYEKSDAQTDLLGTLEDVETMYEYCKINIGKEKAHETSSRRKSNDSARNYGC